MSKKTKDKRDKKPSSKKVKKAEVIKKGDERGVVNPAVPRFGNQSQTRGKEEINPKSTHKPVQERSGIRGNR